MDLKIKIIEAADYTGKNISCLVIDGLPQATLVMAILGDQLIIELDQYRRLKIHYKGKDLVLADAFLSGRL